MNFNYFIFLILFVWRSRKELYEIIFNPKSKIKINRYDLPRLLLRKNCQARVTTNYQSLNFNLRDIADLTVLIEIFIHNTYPLRLKQEPKVIFDIGGHSGFFSILCAVYWQNTKIYCFEPDPNNFKNCQLNIDINKPLTEQIKVFNFGFSNKDKQANFNQYSFSAHNSLHQFYKPIRKIQVELKSFKKYLAPFKKIDILKIDTEGSEYKILYSLTNQEFKKINKIMLEIHDIDQQNKNARQLSRFLNKFYQKSKNIKNSYYFYN